MISWAMSETCHVCSFFGFMYLWFSYILTIVYKRHLHKNWSPSPPCPWCHNINFQTLEISAVPNLHLKNSSPLVRRISALDSPPLLSDCRHPLSTPPYVTAIMTIILLLCQNFFKHKKWKHNIKIMPTFKAIKFFLAFYCIQKIKKGRVWKRKCTIVHT